MSDREQRGDECAIPLREVARLWTLSYLESHEDLGVTGVSVFYRDFLDEVEEPLIDEILIFTMGNQTRAATMLGMNRATLKTRLSRYLEQRKLKRLMRIKN